MRGASEAYPVPPPLAPVHIMSEQGSVGPLEREVEVVALS